MSTTEKRFGYGIAVVFNVVALVFVQYVLEWGILPFLTDEFAIVAPWITLSIGVSIVANLGFMLASSERVVSWGKIVMNATSLAATWVMLDVFPFDFTGYEFDWAPVTRIVLILAMIGTLVGAITEAVKLAKGSAPDRAA
jgi:hypothetical protein